MEMKQFFPKSEKQKESLLKKIEAKNPSIANSLQNVYGGWLNEAWPESTFREITPPKN
jgi:phosphorylcholine metabolism protein LicD